MPLDPAIIQRRTFLGAAAGAAAAVGLAREPVQADTPPPNVLFVMTDQQRADTIAALGNGQIHTPNMDRLVRRGAAFTHGYSTCPVCVPARYTIRTGCEPHTTGIYHNGQPDLLPEQPQAMEERCGAYLARAMSGLGYRTFGMGKFHTSPRNEDLGFETHLHSEEMYGTLGDRARDAYAPRCGSTDPPFPAC